MSYGNYRTNSAGSRGRGFSTRGSFRGRGGDGSSGSWNSTGGRGRGGFSGPSRGRFNWYKEHSSSNFDSRNRYGSGGTNPGTTSTDRYSSRGQAEDSYRHSYREVSDYTRDHSHHRSPERKRMRTDHSYVQASSGRRSHEGSYGGGNDYNSRYSYSDDKEGYGEDRSRGYREDRRPTGSYRDRSREDYPHRKADQLESGMPPPSGGPPRHVSSPRGSRGRVSRGTRGISRMALARRPDILARKRSIMDSYAMRKRILTSRTHPDIVRRLKMTKTRRMREVPVKIEGKEKDGSVKEEDGMEVDDEEKEENWDEEVEKQSENPELEEGETSEKTEKKKKIKKTKDEEPEEGEEVDDEEEEDDEEDEDKEEQKKHEMKPDIEPRPEEIKRTLFHGKPFIRLKCPHCFIRCVTFKEYSAHFSSSKHMDAMRKKSLKLKQTLKRMRMAQRHKQRLMEIGNGHGSLTSGSSKFCPLCKLIYRQQKVDHLASSYHRAMAKLLMPFCKVCRVGFKSPMLYENHVSSLDHIKREQFKERRMRELSCDEGSGIEDEYKELNLDKFMTLDSVGTVDEDGDDGTSDGDGKIKSEKEKKENDEKKRSETNLGAEYIKKVETYLCELCHVYLRRLEPPERALFLHCRSRLHLQHYIRYRNLASYRESDRHHHKKSTESSGKEQTSSDTKKDAASEKMADSTTEKGTKNVAEGDKTKNADSDVEMQAETAHVGDDVPAGTEPADAGEDMDQESDAHTTDKVWANVDKDLGDLLRELQPENKSSDEDEDEDSRAEGGRYDRFRYSEKGSSVIDPDAEGDVPDTTKAAVDGETESADVQSPKDAQKAPEIVEENDTQADTVSPSNGTAVSTTANAAN